MQRNQWEILTGLFIAGTKTINGETIISGWDRQGRPVSLKVSGSCEKIEKKNAVRFPRNGTQQRRIYNATDRTDQRGSR